MKRIHHHFPKWLDDEERFEIVCVPLSPNPFQVRLYNKYREPYDGFGDSITKAAKDALKKREASKK